MRKEYDFSSLESRKNPYARLLKRQITIRINEGALSYFKGMADEVGVPYQNLIDSYLTDCAQRHKKLNMKWA